VVTGVAVSVAVIVAVFLVLWGMANAVVEEWSHD
jgi:hypothetical protein